ncbi:MAG TPA: hypothetical protein VM716_01005 [Gemmatimonadales bacterium]|nr:hypothetical protein [Gemmatimonadales bacterium]
MSCAAGAMAIGLPFDLTRPVETRRTCLLDLREQCGLRESVAGYASVLASLSSAPHRGALIVPAALAIPPAAVRMIVAWLQAGATAILESGAGFAAESTFRVHQGTLRASLQIRVEPPVALWASSRSAPYVDYTWPYPTKLRDFSRVVPLGPQAGEIIASVDGLPVALRRRNGLGGGTLIFIGSPVGPAIWAGDAEARRWLFDVVTSLSNESARPG